MQSLLDRGKGAMLVGAHLGNFDVLRLIAREAKIPVNVLMYIDNAQRINEAFQKLDSKSMIRVINVGPNSARMAFQIRECVKRGEFVAVLSDRVGPNTNKRVSRLEFLGKEAPFSEGPFFVAMLMELPVIFTIALKRGPRAYEIFMEEISDGKIDPEISRKEAVSKHMARFVSRLEHYCLSDPLQWFNFFDFWSGGENENR
jgi:predicted LPLAT superfamily acyltransferase